MALPTPLSIEVCMNHRYIEAICCLERLLTAISIPASVRIAKRYQNTRVNESFPNWCLTSLVLDVLTQKWISLCSMWYSPRKMQLGISVQAIWGALNQNSSLRPCISALKAKGLGATGGHAKIWGQKCPKVHREQRHFSKTQIDLCIQKAVSGGACCYMDTGYNFNFKQFWGSYHKW